MVTSQQSVVNRESTANSLKYIKFYLVYGIPRTLSFSRQFETIPAKRYASMNKRLIGLTSITLLLAQTASIYVLLGTAWAQSQPQKSAVQKTATQDTAQALSQGEKLSKQYKYKEAEPFFTEALRSNPKSVSAMLGLSKVYRHQGKPSQSYSLVNAAISLEPNNALCYIESAKLFHVLHRYPKAILACKKAVQLAPDNAEAYYYLGWCQDLMSDKEATKNLRKAVQLDPKNQGAWRILAFALWQQNRREEAKQCLQAAIKLSPKTIQYQTELADFLFEENKLKEAAAIYNDIKKIAPKSPVPYLGLAAIAGKQGHTKEQGDLLRQATVIRPTSELAWLRLAQFHCEQRNFDESIRCARIALGFKPKSAQNNCALAICLFNADKPQEAEPYLQKSVVYATNLQERLRSQDLLVHLYFMNNKNDRAMELAKEMYRLAPNEYWSISAMAWALMCFKEYDKGFALLEKGKKLFPDDTDFDKDHLGGLVSAERYAQAKALGKKLLLKKPNDTYIWMCLMTVATKTHNKKDAEEAMKHTRGLKLSSYEAMEMGFGGLSVGADASSQESLKQAVENNPASVDLIMNTRDPKAEKTLSNMKSRTHK